MKMTANDDVIIGRNFLCWSFAFVSSSDEGSRRHITIARTRNKSPAAMWTSFAGRKVNRLPNRTATALWITNAPAAPQKTAVGLFLVARSKVANAVLSGNSDKKMRAKVEL